MSDGRKEKSALPTSKAGRPADPEAGVPRRSLRITEHAADVDRDVRDEVDFYLDMRTDELIEEGMDPEAARAAAVEAFGDRRHVEGELQRITAPAVAAANRAELLGSLSRDLRFALRSLRKQPAFTAVACLTIALCIGANAAVFSVVNGVVLQPLPFPEADRLLALYNSYPGAGVPRSSVSPADYFARQEGLSSVENVAIFNEISMIIGEEEASTNVFSMMVSPSFFDVLGVEPAAGRTLQVRDSEPGNTDVAVISTGFWQSQFGGGADALGSTFATNDRVLTVVGIMPEGFRFTTWDAHIWAPLQLDDGQREQFNNAYSMIGRLAGGATADEAQAEMDALSVSIMAEWPIENRQMMESVGYRAVIVGLQDDLLQEIRRPLLLLWGSVAFVLLVGGLNVANLLLVRSSSRLQELSTRFVLGASRWRIARQLLTESLVVSLIGGTLGLLLSTWSLRFLSVFEYYQVPRLAEVTTNMQTVWYTLALVIGVTAVASVLPALVVQRSNLYAAFRGGAATSDGGAGRAGGLLTARSALVAGQVAMAFVLLAGGSLLLVSLLNIWAVDPGFDSNELLAGAVLLNGDRYSTAADRIAFINEAREELAAQPGIRAASFASQLPFSDARGARPITPEHLLADGQSELIAHYFTAVSSDYFETLGIPLLAGRDFDERDTVDQPLRIVIDKRLAELYWPGESPLGKRMAADAGMADEVLWLEVIGVVGEVVQNDLDQSEARGAFYMSFQQSTRNMMRLVARSNATPAAAAAEVRAVIRRLDAEMPVFWVQTMNASIAERLIPRRIPMMMVMTFATLALLLTILGVYGVLSYTVAQRTREIGIRVALGGTTSTVYRLMLGQALAVIGVGLALGLGGALLTSSFLESQLFEVQPADPAVLTVVAGVIAGVALLACLLPTRRATRVDPMVALRTD